MIASEIRTNARKSLQRKWGKAALMTLSFSLIIFVITFLLNLIPVIGTIAYVVISLPISYGFIASFIKLKRDEEVGYIDFLSIGFSSFGKVWAVYGNTLLKLIIPFALAIVFAILLSFSATGSFVSLVLSDSPSAISSIVGFSGIALIAFIGYFVSMIYFAVKSYYYVLAYNVLYDNPDKTGKEIVEESEALMKGHRWNYFWLGLTFIGWVFLSVFTLYIGLFWLIPYMIVSTICFYDKLANKETVVESNDDADSDSISE